MTLFSIDMSSDDAPQGVRRNLPPTPPETAASCHRSGALVGMYGVTCAIALAAFAARQCVQMDTGSAQRIINNILDHAERDHFNNGTTIQTTTPLPSGHHAGHRTSEKQWAHTIPVIVGGSSSGLVPAMRETRSSRGAR